MKICIVCGGRKWKRFFDVNTGQICNVCVNCGFFTVVGVRSIDWEVGRYLEGYWDGLIDNQEKILELEYEKGLR